MCDEFKRTVDEYVRETGLEAPRTQSDEERRLSAIIDFGTLAVGDPACDSSIAWKLLQGESRGTFRAMLPVDPGTWARGRAWTLWKALIVAAGLTERMQLKQHDLGASLTKCLALMPNLSLNTDASTTGLPARSAPVSFVRWGSQ